MPFFIENKKFPHPAWTKDNDGHGSLADADVIDGYHFQDLEDRYVNVVGDTMSGHLLFSVAGERAVKATGIDINWGLYLNNVGFGLYDWQNTRSILAYNKTSNTLGFGNSETTISINGAIVNLTSAAGINISGTAYNIDGTVIDIDGTVLTIDGSVSLTHTSPLTTINASTSVTIVTPILNLNGTSVVISGNRVLTVADKDINSGIPQLNTTGDLQVKGNKAYLAITSNELFISNRSNTENVMKLVRGGTNIYTGAIQTASSVWSNIITTANINVPNGVAGLNSDNPPNMVIPGAFIGMTPNASGNVHIKDSYNNQWITYWHRNGPWNYSQLINKGSTGDSWATVISTIDSNAGTNGYCRYNAGTIGGGGTYVVDAAAAGSSYWYGGSGSDMYSHPLIVIHKGAGITGGNRTCFMIELDASDYYNAYVWKNGWKKVLTE